MKQRDLDEHSLGLLLILHQVSQSSQQFRSSSQVTQVHWLFLTTARVLSAYVLYIHLYESISFYFPPHHHYHHNLFDCTSCSSVSHHNTNYNYDNPNRYDKTHPNPYLDLRIEVPTLFATYEIIATYINATLHVLVSFCALLPNPTAVQ